MYENLVELFEASCRKFRDRDLFGTKNESWSWITFGEFKESVDALRGALASVGVDHSDRVAIIADNSVEWAAAAYATYGRGACFVPMYTAQKPDEWKFILEDSGAKVAFAATEAIYNELRRLVDEVASLERVVGISLPDSHDDSYQAFLKLGRENPTDPVYPKPTDLAGYIYTSGTTGQPKGVKLNHHNFCSNVDASRQLFPLHAERSLAFLPWAHSFGQTAELHFFLQGGHSIAINNDTAELVANLAVVRPTILLAVPRIFNRIYDGVNKQMAEKPAPIRKLFQRGLDLAGARNRGERLGLVDKATLALAEKLIFSKVRQKFGGRLKLVISGSAALNKDVAEFIDALGIMVYEGYGLTETSPVAAANFPGNRKIGSVGKAVPGCRIELDQSKSDIDGEGEIVVYGPNVMQGYHNRPEDNANVLLEGGGFRTGDLGTMDGEGYLYITGRIKEQYKLENGKYVAPALLEERLKLSPFIANVFLFGANKPYNVAIVVPDEDSVRSWADKQGVSLNGLDTDDRVKDLLKGELEKFGSSFKSYEKPQKIAVSLEDFTTDNGLLSQSLKVKRRNVIKKYQSTLDALYWEANQ